MLVSMSEIKIDPGRREVVPDKVKELAKSIEQIGLLNPITVSADYTLIAGNHRLEAAKLLGWTEIECTVSDLSGLLAELAEIDENFVRSSLSPIEFGDLLLRRKEIYEGLHPETKHGGDRSKRPNWPLAPEKSFVEDTSEKLGIAPRTIRREIQTAKNLTPEVKNMLHDANVDISKTAAHKLSRLKPEQQEQAATQLVNREIKSVDEYQKPYSIGGKHFDTLEESIADLKSINKDSRYTPGTLLADMDGLIDRFHRDFAWYDMNQCTEVFPEINREQLDYITKRFATITSAIKELLHKMERSIDSEK